MNARGGWFTIFALVALSLPLGCAQGGGGGGAASTSSGAAAGSGAGTGTGTGTGASLPSSLRLVAFDRRALSPSASARLDLLVERPAGVDPARFVVEESADGVTYYAIGQGASATFAAGLLYEVPIPSARRYFRVSAPAPSNTVMVDFSSSGIAQAPLILGPTSGAAGVPALPTISAAGGAGAQTFLYAVADAEGTLAWLAESATVTLAPSDAGAKTFIATAGLAPASGHTATVIALDVHGFGAAAAPRVDFTTAP